MFIYEKTSTKVSERMRKQEDIIEVLVELTCGFKRRGDQDIIYFK